MDEATAKPSLAVVKVGCMAETMRRRAVEQNNPDLKAVSLAIVQLSQCLNWACNEIQAMGKALNLEPASVADYLAKQERIPEPYRSELPELFRQAMERLGPDQ